MEYGILVAEDRSIVAYQIVCAVDSVDEAKEHIDNYIAHGPDCDLLAPETFVIMRRDGNGYYTRREEIEF